MNLIIFNLIIYLCTIGVKSGKVVSDFRLGTEVKPIDFDDKKSSLSERIKFLNFGTNKAVDVLRLNKNQSKYQELGISINDKSIFIPGSGKPQLGFRYVVNSMPFFFSFSFFLSLFSFLFFSRFH